eukprot:SAG31_NODE_3372_length_4351_cov_4.835842_4_plen_75_part_00
MAEAVYLRGAMERSDALLGLLDLPKVKLTSSISIVLFSCAPALDRGKQYDRTSINLVWCQNAVLPADASDATRP